jgi:hypothetical protein
MDLYNIADYGHAGDIEKSRLPLKALKLDPNDVPKKGIAWIVYSFEKIRMKPCNFNSVTQNHNAPDYYLLKADIADFQRDHSMKR